MRRAAIALPVLLLAALAVGAPPGNPVTPRPRVEMAWNRFYDVEETAAALRRLAEAHPGWLRLSSIGKSVQGRDLWLAVLADPDGPPDRERPAMYIDANVHGNEIQGTEVCLYTIWWLLENRERPELASLLRRVAFYIVPTVNPDGRHSWFHDPATRHTPRTGLAPVDDDRDGRADEDGPNDLDGDGSIVEMRKRVARGGTHRVDPEDPRVMVPVPRGEEGTHLLLGWEGLDDDGDGRVNEDGPGGYDMNRNFPGDWQPEWIQHGAGPYPLCWPETRAVAEFLLDRPNVAAVQSYHNTGGMILRGPGRRDDEYERIDTEVYDALGEAGEEMLPHYRYEVLGRDLYPVRGGFVTWTFEALGIFSFTNELWSRRQLFNDPPRERGERGSRDGSSRAERTKRRLRGNDRLELGRHFVDWKPYQHPVYGDIEIGGWKKTASRVPPTFMLEELCHRNAAFTLFHADQMPRLALEAPVIDALGDGLWRVRAEVRNERLIPTVAARARRLGLGLPDFFSIETDGRVVAGGRLEGEALRERPVAQEHRPHRLRIEAGVPSHGRVRVEWILVREGETAPRVALRYASQKGGTVVRAPD